MKKGLLYIFGVAAMMQTSCSDDMVDSNTFLNDKEKTPIEVSALMDMSSGASTRAADMTFDNGDKLIAYLRHVTWDGSTGARTSVSADQAPRLVTFTTTGSEAWSGSDITPIGTGVALGMTGDNTEQATGLTATPALYWDDFSDSASDGTDLRTSGHYLQSYYGYCYNGGTPTTELTPADGTLGWTVATDQHEGIKTSDLLWSYEQEPVAYSHATTRKGLIIPYTHAMSKVTIEIICGNGFDTNKENFKDASVILKNMNTVASLTAPTGTCVAVPGTENANVKDITTLKIADGTSPKVKHSFTALIAPTMMKDGQVLAEIKLVDGNNYKVVLSNDVLDTSVTNDWASKLTDYNSTDGGTTQPGVNYLITVTVNKQEILVKATIQGWETVSASGVGVMDFTANIISSTTSGTDFITNGAQFNLWRAMTDGVNDNYDEITSTSSVVDKATTLTYSTTPTAGWSASPKIYWPNNSTSYYFRALAKYDGTNYVGFEGEDAAHTSTTDLKVSQGTDLVWGTTADHTGTKQEGGTQHYDKGAAINPRTSEVPMAFEHAMAKISVKLESVAGAEGVDVEGAKISIVNIYDGGTVSFTDGKIVDLTASGTMPILDFGDMNSSVTNKLNQFCVIPQSLVMDKDGNERAGATTFYTPNDLTLIYNDNTSLSTGGGTGETYVTSTLSPKYYTESQAKAYNATLAGHVTTDSDKELAREYTLTEYNALSLLPHASISETDFNNLSEAAKTKEAARAYTLVEFKALTALTETQFNALPNEWKTKPAYTKEEADEYNATLTGAVTTSDTNPETSNNYTPDEAATHNATLEGAVHEGSSKGIYTLQEYNDLTTKPIASITQEQYDQLPDLSKTKPAEYYSWDEFKGLTTLTQIQFSALPETMRTRPAVKYTQDEADAYNAKLPGAKSTMDVHHYVTNGSSQTAVAGDIKSNGTKVVLHIMLADNTGYTLNLATCKDSNTSSSTYNQPIYTWERGKHYIYTITLGKEEITFRALIKEWEEVNGGGNATLDW